MSEIPEDVPSPAAPSDETLRIIRELGLTSYMCVPLVARGRTLGALTFALSESSRRYTSADLHFAQDVADRAALAVDNARSFRQALEANRAKDEFLATLSHELRTPLNAVLGWTRMLRSGAIQTDKAEHALEVIERNATAQLTLIEDLLDVSRIISGKFRLDVQSVDLPAAIRAAVESLQPTADAKQVRLQAVLDPKASPVYGDSGRLQQAVWNLVSNSIKFTRKGGRVQVTLLRMNSHVELIVSDNGQGIEKDALPFIFDRFRQGEVGATRTHAGLGLGLAIVKHIVELHGGSVRVESDGEGCGATFRVMLPIMVSRTEPDVPGRVHPSVSGGPDAMTLLTPSIQGLRVLVVEDDAEARDLITHLLQDRGAEVVAAASAEQGLVALQTRIPDVMISDIEMPGQDGFRFIRAVRSRPAEQGGTVPAVALTAYARPEDRARSLMSGFQVHLAKPVDLGELVATLASLSGKT